MTAASSVIVRALNACRLRHRPTYVALRALLDCECNPQHVENLVGSATRKLQARSEWRYYSYPILKEIDGENKPHYRNCIIGSPFTLVAEAKLLALLSEEPSFAKHSTVYSYLWPRDARSGHNYRYYRHGYLARNKGIQRLISAAPDNVAVVNDIRKFYPSVRWSELQPRIDQRLKRFSIESTRRAARGFFAAFGSASKNGIGVGPDVSHVLADIALEDVDAAMQASWGDRYFRYVDDIIVVCKAFEVATVQEQLKNLLYPLELHEGKQDVVDATTWMRECPQISSGLSPGSFEELLRAIELMLLNDPRKLRALEGRFRDAGFSVPFRRLMVKTRYGRFRRFLRRWFKPEIRGLMSRDVDGLLQQATGIRDSLRSQLLQLGKNPPNEGTRRRWFVQNVRYRLNRLIYLSSRNDAAQVIELIPRGSEFQEQRELLTALAARGPLRLLPLPGATVATYCELAIEGDELESPADWPLLDDRAKDESATLFALLLGWTVPDSAKAQMYPGSRILLDEFSGTGGGGDEIEHQTYLDEIHSLLRDSTADALQRYAHSRTSIAEVRGLEGLGLGDDYS